MRFLLEENLQRPRLHQRSDVLAEDGQQPCGSGVAGIIGLGLLDDVVRERPDIAEQLFAVAGQAVQGGRETTSSADSASMSRRCPRRYIRWVAWNAVAGVPRVSVSWA